MSPSNLSKLAAKFAQQSPLQPQEMQLLYNTLERYMKTISNSDDQSIHNIYSSVVGSSKEMTNLLNAILTNTNKVKSELDQVERDGRQLLAIIAKKG